MVDNHSTDGSWICLEQEFPDVERVVRDNFGFAGDIIGAIKNRDDRGGIRGSFK